MKILFIHQSFPGQYRHIVNSLAKQQGHLLVALGINPPAESIPKSVRFIRYKLERGNTEGIHPLVSETESKVIRAESCAKAAFKLKNKGFTPDIICAHPGWGEALFLQDIWQESPILSYQEFYYIARGFDYDFDPEFQSKLPWQNCAKVRMKNAHSQLNLESSRWNVTPTLFQRSTFPANWQAKISAIHDGIDTAIASPTSSPVQLKLPDNSLIQSGDPIVTFFNRSLEPYRGCHSFIRAIPTIHDLYPEARIVIVGSTKGVSYGKPCENGEYKDKFMEEIKGHYNQRRVHFTEKLPYDQLLTLLKISAAHVYLTYPFVLSWSLLEAMSSECAIVGSKTPPVEEVIQHSVNGLLVDFFEPKAIGTAVCDLLRDRKLAKSLGEKARKSILQKYSLEVCLPQQLNLINLVANGAIGY
ncbi:glycosyltransferase family 4 protein [Prochlorococcus sp. MIT 1303]|uniref:glycosyltransferase family 4 protein n=1 Tax=Prochlorococcus sp. MIT 1303 TaxID=1723647 RepID=UPI0007B35369|nr:glycosyltransferase family 4 protein [Prochlorococcus sp. MIT 1303]KZR61791.1 D-inositol 3-phosphate glycosyltransferase [Prochlorococcus sp. MIT 1303]